MEANLVLQQPVPPEPLEALATEVRVAFSAGISADACALLLRAREAGLGWEPLTAAVAAGIAARTGAPSQPQRTPGSGRGESEKS
jgi:hypothetical protein